MEEHGSLLSDWKVAIVVFHDCVTLMDCRRKHIRTIHSCHEERGGRVSLFGRPLCMDDQRVEELLLFRLVGVHKSFRGKVLPHLLSRMIG